MQHQQNIQVWRLSFLWDTQKGHMVGMITALGILGIGVSSSLGWVPFWWNMQCPIPLYISQVLCYAFEALVVECQWFGSDTFQSYKCARFAYFLFQKNWSMFNNTGMQAYLPLSVSFLERFMLHTACSSPRWNTPYIWNKKLFPRMFLIAHSNFFLLCSSPVQCTQIENMYLFVEKTNKQK